MRVKDALSGFYIFGEYNSGERVDLAYDGNDILEAVDRAQALQVIAVVDNLVSLCWAAYHLLPPDGKEKFSALVGDVKNMRELPGPVE